MNTLIVLNDMQLQFVVQKTYSELPAPDSNPGPSLAAQTVILRPGPATSASPGRLFDSQKLWAHQALHQNENPG